jgi:alkylation response protein AidB-like acyl-CoA dehydrogenase
MRASKQAHIVFDGCRMPEENLVGVEGAGFYAERGMQLHGGRSILNENRIARVYRDVRIPVIYEGANEMQRDLVYNQPPT